MRELIERLITEGTIPSWAHKAAKSKVVLGPNGNKAIAYEWKWMWEEVFSKIEDGLVGKKVSDWDEALTCASCGRRIVRAKAYPCREVADPSLRRSSLQPVRMP